MIDPETVCLPARMDSLHTFLTRADACAEKLGFSPGRISDLELALEELLVNIINYAYTAEEGPIEMTCRADPHGRLVVEIADSGVPFDMLAYSDPDTSLEIEDRRIGGLGIFFVKKLMDDVRYRRENDRNILTIVASANRKAEPDEKE